ncbi:protealysin inhibitor emfourin [uncultured Methanofollis sp.]|uniref:protealysin inhibitor emfourin n=1 Tax=uncultured Methanofollis sp. TaxID=262500 RepID=UPI0026143C73|nr:protealysin inhibitor emfourin [uncultured Methanofollis sp.]
MKQILTLLLLGCILALAGAAGCTSNDTSSPVVVEYHRTGGFAGFNDTVVVYENRTADVSRHGDLSTMTLDAADLTQIRAMVTSDSFQSLRDEYLPLYQGYDLFSYEVTAGGKTVRATDGAVPEALAGIISEMDAIITQSLP